jgi:tRNA isopentenyl-2-thiomethyl-A-37 hydroxylase MiaE
MSNYPNMSYCMNENTLAALQQILMAMENDGPAFVQELSRSEARAYRDLVYACQSFLDTAEDFDDQIAEMEEEEVEAE